MRLLNKNKKAQEAHTGGLGDLIHIVLVVLLVLLVFGVGGALYAAVTGGGEQSSESNFDSLADNIQLMIDKPTSFEHQTMLFYLKEEKYLVAGLNAEKSSIPTSKYPKTCENKPCLCLYKDSGVFPSEPYKCKIFPESVIFHGYGQEKLILIRGSLFSPTPSFSLQLQKQPAELYSDYPPELIIEYEGLALIAAKDFTHNLYIEKFVKDNRIHILVTPMFTQDEIDIRISVLSTCPLGSDQDCDGKRRNSFTDDAKTQYCYYDEANQRCLLKTDFKTCVFDQKVTADCLCGDEFASGSRGLYCFNRADGEIFLVPFNCKAPEYASISNKCPLYCGVLTQTEGCVGDEQYYCEKDPCGFGTESNPCIVEQKGSKIICKQKT